MDFPLPKKCADIRRGGVGEHGGGKRRHSSTARRARRVEEWRRLPPPCQAQPHLPPFVCVIKCHFPSQAASYLLGNGKCIVVAGLAPAMLATHVRRKVCNHCHLKHVSCNRRLLVSMDSYVFQ